MTEQVDGEGNVYTTDTPTERLKTVGKTHVITNATMMGVKVIEDAVWPTDEWKKAQRYSVTQENPEDTNGLGYQFTNTTEPDL